ncbi:MAG: phosphotransferase family protein [Polyangiaceae bacterium]
MPLLPACPTAAAYQAIEHDKRLFLPAVQAIAAAHGLSAPVAEDALDASDVVYRVGASHVLKLVAPPFHEELARECAALARVALSVPTPKVIARGQLEGWPYFLMTRVGGVPASELWRDLTLAEQRALIAELGSIVAELPDHSAGTRDPFPGAAWDAFIEASRAGFARRCARWKMDPESVAQLERWMDDVLESPGLPRADALVHGDLTTGNVHLEYRDGHLRVAAIVDFGDARIGPRLYELVTPLAFYCRGNRELSRALFKGFALHTSAERDLVRPLMALSLLHPFNSLDRWCGWCNVERRDYTHSQAGIDCLARRLILGDEAEPARAGPSS